MTKKYFCSRCFVELREDEDVNCDECADEINLVMYPNKNYKPKVKDEEWIEVKSPFKPYKEGV